MDRLEKLTEEIQQDTELHQYMDLKKASLEIPYLHSKYLQKCEAQRMRMKMVEQKKDKLHHNKKLYYLGKGNPELYQENPLDHTILKADVEGWIRADNDYINLLQQLEYEKALLNILEATVKRISNRSFYIKNYIEMHKFENGIV